MLPAPMRAILLRAMGGSPSKRVGQNVAGWIERGGPVCNRSKADPAKCGKRLPAGAVEWRAAARPPCPTGPQAAMILCVPAGPGHAEKNTEKNQYINKYNVLMGKKSQKRQKWKISRSNRDLLGHERFSCNHHGRAPGNRRTAFPSAGWQCARTRNWNRRPDRAGPARRRQPRPA